MENAVRKEFNISNKHFGPPCSSPNPTTLLQAIKNNFKTIVNINLVKYNEVGDAVMIIKWQISKHKNKTRIFIFKPDVNIIVNTLKQKIGIR